MHRGGEECCRRSVLPQAKNPAWQDSFLPFSLTDGKNCRIIVEIKNKV